MDSIPFKWGKITGASLIIMPITVALTRCDQRVISIFEASSRPGIPVGHSLE